MRDFSLITFTEPDAADLPGHLRVRTITAMEWWTKRPAPPARYQVDSLPTLDELWTVYLFMADLMPPELEAVCRYTEDVRQGRWVDRVPPEHAFQAVYLALAHDLKERLHTHQMFLDEAFSLFDYVATRVVEGDSLIDMPVLATEPQFQRYVSMLVDDLRLYQEDARRAQVWKVSLPPRQVTLFAIDKPASTQFKLWARRRDDHALLLVRQPDGTLVLSADPSSKLRVDIWAAALSKADRAPWYAGERHGGTLIASARDGTLLTFEDVRKVLKGRKRHAPLSVGVLAGLGLAVLAGVYVVRPGAPGAKGDPLDTKQVVKLLAEPDGPRSFARYAMVIGVCGYTGEHVLEAPCEDARAVRNRLVGTLGYRREDILFFVDEPREGDSVDGVPDAATLKLAVERFRARFPGAGPQSSFLFYYSGHGGYEKGARKDFGVLQPSGYFERPDAPMGERGWDMQELVDDLRKGVPSKHVMVILDTCYSGWAVGAKGDAHLSPEVRSLWQERAEVVLTAGTKGQRAWEDEGRSVFTTVLLEGLRGAADTNGDGVITDEELASFVRLEVPQRVATLNHGEETPQFFRFDDQLPKSGQFLFLPQH